MIELIRPNIVNENVRAVTRAVYGGDIGYAERNAITISRRSSRYLSTSKIMRNNIVLLLAAFVLLAGNASANEVVNCPTSKSDRNVFKIPSTPQTSVAIESGNDGSHPIVLITYRSIGNGKCERYTLAKYGIEGSAPKIDSLFFYKINNKINVLTLVHWDINNRGIGTYGKLYQIYAYEIDENQQLRENSSITNKNSMTGIDGYADGRKSTFTLKTAADVKRALAESTK